MLALRVFKAFLVASGIKDRYPDNITKDDYDFMSKLGPMIEEESF